MVRADDAHKSTNEAEKNTLIQQNFVEKLKFWKLRDEDEHEPARLTAMPSCLMHWWTPVPYYSPLSSLPGAAFWHRSGACHSDPSHGKKSTYFGPLHGHLTITGPPRMQWPCAQQSRAQASHSRHGSRGATIMQPKQSKHRQRSNATTTGSAANIFTSSSDRKILAYGSAQLRYSPNWQIPHHIAIF